MRNNRQGGSLRSPPWFIAPTPPRSRFGSLGGRQPVCGRCSVAARVRSAVRLPRAALRSLRSSQPALAIAALGCFAARSLRLPCGCGRLCSPALLPALLPCRAAARQATLRSPRSLRSLAPTPNQVCAQRLSLSLPDNKPNPKAARFACRHRCLYCSRFVRVLSVSSSTTPTTIRVLLCGSTSPFA